MLSGLDAGLLTGAHAGFLHLDGRDNDGLLSSLWKCTGSARMQNSTSVPGCPS